MKKTLMRFLTLLQLGILLTLATYSWFAERTTPTIAENSIKVTSAEGLLIKLDPDSPSRLNVSLNEIMADFSSFELNQVSSADAESFYYVDFGQGLSQGNPQFVLVQYELDGSLDMHKYGFIDYTFYLQTEDFAKHVYLHKDTAFSGSGADSMRFALTITDSSNNTTTNIFGTAAENGISNPYTTEAVIDDGEFIFNNIDPALIGDQVVHLISEKNGGRGTSDTDPLDLNKLLVTMPANTQITVNVKIWLEGGDVDCDNTIASTLLDFILKFGSANVLLAAPNVTPDNNDFSINNLTTAMEYGYTNDSNTVWTTVTDPDMTFGTGQTVYVRIAAVPGVSPESYATTVTFN